MNDDSEKSPKTWKEWAIQISTEQEVTIDDVKDLYAKHEKLQEKHDKLKEDFIRLETRVYVAVPVIIVVMEIIVKEFFK